MSKATVALAAALALVLAATGSGAGGYLWGRAHGRTQCQADKATTLQGQIGTTAVAQGNADATTKAAIKRSAATGTARERDRAAIDQFFTQLQDRGQDEATSSPVDADQCVLPDQRLRLWAAANAGLAGAADSGTPAAQPHGAAAAAAAPTLGPGEGPGSQPPPGGPDVPPAGQPDVPAAGRAAGAP